MKKLIFYYAALILSAALLVTLTYGCQDPYMGLEKIATDNIAPSEVLIESVIPHSGALLIEFSLDDTDGDIAQIKASYKVGQETRDFTVSRYDRSILVEGFSKINEKTISLIAIDNSGNESKETIVKGTPLIAPVNVLYNSLEISPAFGGLLADWENPTKASLVIHIMRNDTTVNFGKTLFVEDPAKRIYSADSLTSTTQKVVGDFPPELLKMGFYVTDQWRNVSDTLVVKQTPFEQSEINYEEIEYIANLFGEPGPSSASLSYEDIGLNSDGILKDAPYHSGFYHPINMFDHSHIGPWQPKYRYADETFCDTVYNTFDLNVDIVFSKIHLWGRRNKATAYQNSTVKEFIVYGTTDENINRATNFPEGWDLIYKGTNPEPDPSWSSDQKLAEFNKGFVHFMPPGVETPKVRYIRIGFLSNYGGGAIYTNSDLKLYGSIKAEYY